MKIYVHASSDFDEMSYQDFKKRYKTLVKKYPDLAMAFGRNWNITLIKEEYEKQGSKWVLVEKTKNPVSFENYINSLDASPFFKNLGGKEYIAKSYTPAGYIPVEIQSTSPDGMQKTIRKYIIEM